MRRPAPGLASEVAGKAVVINPALLTMSGERTLRRAVALASVAMPPEQFLTALGTAVEVHVSRLVGFLVSLSDVDKTTFGRELIAAVEDDLTRTWRDRNRWLTRGFGIPVAGHAPWQRFDTVVEARNTVVHGDGYLSDLQASRTLQQISELRARYRKELDIGLNGGRLQFAASSVDLAHNAARQYVSYLDGAVLVRYPAVRQM